MAEHHDEPLMPYREPGEEKLGIFPSQPPFRVVEAAPIATHTLPVALKVLLAFNALVIAVHVWVAQAIRLPPGYQLRTDAKGGGPGDGLYLLFVLALLVLPALVIILSDLGVLVWAFVARRRRACKALLLAIALWCLAIAFELR
jgi:hypothetical protein